MKTTIPKRLSRSESIVLCYRQYAFIRWESVPQSKGNQEDKNGLSPSASRGEGALVSLLAYVWALFSIPLKDSTHYVGNSGRSDHLQVTSKN